MKPRVSAFITAFPILGFFALFALPTWHEASDSETASMSSAPAGAYMSSDMQVVTPPPQPSAPGLSFDQMEATVRDAIDRRNAELDVDYLSSNGSVKDEIDRVFADIFSNDNYLHYITRTFHAAFLTEGRVTRVHFSFTYWETKEQTDYVYKETAAIVSGLIQDNMTDLQKETVIHDWIATHVRFDESLTAHSAYAGLASETNEETVCQGYALLTYQMLRLAGVPVRIVSGTAGNESHIWNMVQIDGSWKHLDVTWDRAVQGSHKPRYGYFNLTDKQIAKDHQLFVDPYSGFQ